MFKTRPSQLLAIEDPYAAFCLDEAVAWFGGHVESELDKVEGKKPEEIRHKKERLLKRLLTGKVLFEDPSASGKVPIRRG